MAKDISKSVNVPQAYLAKLLQELSRRNIISSTRGPKGGFYLNDADRNRTLITIVDAIDGVDKLKTCLLSIKNCNEKQPCPLHQLMAPSRLAFLNGLENKTLGELSSDIKAGRSHLPFN